MSTTLVMVGQHPYEFGRRTVPTERYHGNQAEFEPWSTKRGNDIVGIDADTSKAICDKLGYEPKIEDMSFETILHLSTAKSRLRRS